MGLPGEQDAFDLEEAAQILEATPAMLRDLLAGLPRTWLHFQENPEAWSPHTVLIHFIHNERTNFIPRARVILSGDPVREFHPFRQLPESGELEGLTVEGLLDEFGRLRAENLETLRAFDLRPEDLDRTGVHPVLGEVTLRQLLSTWVVHDLNHTHQITKSLAKRYRESVGPWRANLALLDLG